MNEHHHAAGSLSNGPLAVDLGHERAGWAYSSLRVAQLDPGDTYDFETGDDEVIILPLSGSCTVACESETHRLAGRSGVFDAVSDFAYAPIGSIVRIESGAGGRFALCGARATRRLPFRYVPASDVEVELRGAGQCSRQVVNFATPDNFEADRIIAVEVLTPAGNWSSFPPHKHDEQSERETQLEEIYYFEVADGPDGPGVGYQRVYGTPERPIEVLAEVRTGDVVTIPHGWHGPSMSTPGYHLYYLNVMAGPERDWRICDDPAHGWVRGTWDDQPIDPRLPLTAGG